MKLTFLLALFPLDTLASSRTKESWVGDLETITADYERIVIQAPKQSRRDQLQQHFAYVIPLANSKRHLDSASSYQKTALNPIHGGPVVCIGWDIQIKKTLTISRWDGESCYAMSNYFSTVSNSPFELLNNVQLLCTNQITSQPPLESKLRMTYSTQALLAQKITENFPGRKDR